MCVFLRTDVGKGEGWRVSVCLSRAQWGGDQGSVCCLLTYSDSDYGHFLYLTGLSNGNIRK